jgi:hypothetical protein
VFGKQRFVFGGGGGVRQTRPVAELTRCIIFSSFEVCFDNNSGSMETSRETALERLLPQPIALFAAR